MGIGAIQGAVVAGRAAATGQATVLADQEKHSAAALDATVAIQDELTLSAEAQAAETARSGLLGRAQLFPGVPRGPGNTINIEDIRKYYDERRISLNSQIREAFDQAGIDTSREVRLQMAGDGRVVLANDHPQRRQIEQVFADRPELRNQFAEVSGMSSFLRAADEHMAFAKAYAKDPRAAVAQYSHLFSNLPSLQFNLVLADGECSVDFR